ncbi:hypothetical protein [Kitasatospora sp. NPDC088346]|uniref:hypothetical protein n=1 Tax=Kitasatospora sp. NPDC088346 TaxID=3364073 RepID=UPI00381855D3
MSEESMAYSASTIVVLEGLEAVRKRPGMYIGSVGERGLHHLVFEAAERALDEIIGGTTTRVEITLTDDRDPAGPRAVHFRFPGGPRDHIAEQTAAALHPDVIGFERECPEMAGTIEVALRWRDTGEDCVASYANSRPTTGGGTHELGFRDGVAAALTAYGREQQLLSPSDPDLTPTHLGPGLTAVVSVKLDHPEFEGPIHDRLGNGPVRACVAEAVREHLTAWLHANPAQAATVLARTPKISRD